MQALELLAPARTFEIGIAAIDCGADAVYIAGPGFGARKDAGNSLEDIASLCTYAHKYGARIFMTVNTILYDSELEQAHSMMLEAQRAGVDAFIVQDMAITSWDDIKVPLHASTQCAIRTVQDAQFYKSLGYGRLVLERQLSLGDIRSIHESTGMELEFFVHGALCVCYSGQCYMSERIAGRSANRGACVQACRSLYDLVDEDGKVLVRNKALLSLKDYNLKERMLDLAEAGICSFKVEGRLKNASYVKNVIREYSMALDSLVAEHPDDYCRASWGRVSGGFAPDSDRTFNRGYTSLYIDGRRPASKAEGWSSMDTPKSMGEYIGTVQDLRKIDRSTMEIAVKPASEQTLCNGDGFSIPCKDSSIIGFRGDVCQGNIIRCKAVPGISRGQRIYRNLNAAFEKELERSMPRREIPIDLSVHISGSYVIDITATSQDGRQVNSPFKCDADTAENRERQEAMIREQLSKRADHYILSVKEFVVETSGGKLPLLSASTLNSIRRLVASDIDNMPCKARPLAMGVHTASGEKEKPTAQGYKLNLANDLARKVAAEHGIVSDEPAFELSHKEDAELMRTKYCIRYELGMCPVHQHASDPGRRLLLVNNGRRFALGFDCKHCEMTVSEDLKSK